MRQFLKKRNSPSFKKGKQNLNRVEKKCTVFRHLIFVGHANKGNDCN